MKFSKYFKAGFGKNGFMWWRSTEPGFYCVNGPTVWGPQVWLAVTDDFGNLVRV